LAKKKPDQVRLSSFDKGRPSKKVQEQGINKSLWLRRT